MGAIMHMKNAQSVLAAVLTAGCVLAGAREASAAQSNIMGSACYSITAQNSGFQDTEGGFYVNPYGISQVPWAVMCPLPVVGSTEIETVVVNFYNGGGTFSCQVSFMDQGGDLLEAIPVATTAATGSLQTWTFTPDVESLSAFVSCTIPDDVGTYLTSIQVTSI
jgi:hypothetical protein